MHAARLQAVLITLLVATPFIEAADQRRDTVAASRGLEFIDTGFENVSPLWYEVDGEVVRINLLYDHERSSPNRAAGHIHFLLHARPGSKLTLEFRNLDNVWNGRPGSVAGELKTVSISEDSRVSPCG